MIFAVSMCKEADGKQFVVLLAKKSSINANPMLLLANINFIDVKTVQNMYCKSRFA